MGKKKPIRIKKLKISVVKIENDYNDIMYFFN